MRHIPKKIYLQIGEDCDAKDFKDLNEVTWCQDKIHSTDIEYVRSAQQPEDEFYSILDKCVLALYILEAKLKSENSDESVRLLQITIDKAKSILSKHKERR